MAKTWRRLPAKARQQLSDERLIRGRRKTYLTILKRAWSANFKMVWYVLLRPLRPKLDGQDLA
jgi:hypothetical protein